MKLWIIYYNDFDKWNYWLIVAKNEEEANKKFKKDYMELNDLIKWDKNILIDDLLLLDEVDGHKIKVV